MAKRTALTEQEVARVKRLREEHGLTLTVLARRFGVSYSSIRKAVNDGYAK